MEDNMETFEFTGKTTDDAIAKACKKLNTTRNDINIDIIETGSPGIFGIMGGRKAKIKVTMAIEETTIPDDNNGIDIAKDALENILALIPVKGTKVNAMQSNGTISLHIEGDKSGILIGRKGRTLDALQFIVNRIVNKSLEKRVQLVIDSENYRQRRSEFLVQMASNIAGKAKKHNKTMATNLLNPSERRIIHLALRGDTGLETKSHGDGILKKVLIIPKR